MIAQVSSASDLTNRLADAVRSAAKEAGGYQGLEREIQKLAASDQPPIDRRKLSAMACGFDVSLRVSDVRLLDQYLTGKGCPLLAVPNLVGTLVDKGSVAFVLPSFAAPRGRAVSLHHVESMHAVLAAADGQRAGIHFAVHAVPDGWSSAPPEARKKQYEELLGEPMSFCAVGSPRASVVSELVLAEMFGVHAFGAHDTLCAGPRGASKPLFSKTGGSKPCARLPFSFVWTDSLGRRLKSTFTDHGPARTRVPPGARALILEDTIFVSAPESSVESTTYAVIAAQRRPSGHVRLVLAGLSTLATLCAAQALARGIHAALPDLPAQVTPHHHPASVLWMVIGADIDKAGGVHDVRMVGQPRTFPP